jgi:hypothetical protein
MLILSGFGGVSMLILSVGKAMEYKARGRALQEVGRALGIAARQNNEFIATQSARVLRSRNQ